MEKREKSIRIICSFPMSLWVASRIFILWPTVWEDIKQEIRRLLIPSNDLWNWPVRPKKEVPFLVMEKLLDQVNREVYQLSQKEEKYEGMGTTFVAATVVDQVVYVMNVGDSRLYYYDGSLRQVTMDHSLVEELVRAGELGRMESRHHPQKNIITKAVGVADEIQPDFFMLDMGKGQKILLCSDGLSNMVDDDKLEEIMAESGEVEELAKKCIEEALFYGGLDNIAVVIAQCENGR